MSEAIIGLVSAVAVVVVKGLFDYIMDRQKRKDTITDRKEANTKKEAEDEKKDILEAISKVAGSIETVRIELAAVKQDVAGVKTDIRACQDKVELVDQKAEEGRIIESRVRILRFSDEIFHKQDHSKEHFEQILGDIEAYEEYCLAHPTFSNNITKCSVEIITEKYKELVKEHKF